MLGKLFPPKRKHVDPLSLLPSYIGLTESRYGLMAYLKSDKFSGASLQTYGELSERENALYREIVKPGNIVVEIGANIGGHTVPLSRLVGASGALIAFEPQRVIYQLLCANLGLNGIANVMAHNLGVGRARGMMNVPIVDYAKVDNPGGVALTSGPGEPVEIHTLDEYELHQVDIIKIDVEGMEFDVLKGAEKTVATHRPVIYTENGEGEYSAPLIRLLREMGYRVWWHWPHLFNPDNYFHNPTNIYPGMVSVNMLCVPAERPQNCGDLMEVTNPDQPWMNAVREWTAATKKN